MRIHSLTPLVANQIAAGEVIERPASVVKECVENSLDSGAKHITISLQRGGKQLIQITDDGEGIHPDDLPLAIAAHATSKITELSDLQQLASLGFRGEALASIAAVSEFEIISRLADQEHACRLQYSGRLTQAIIEPATHAVGTTVIARELFFNTPARQAFLRREQTELQQIEGLIKSLALSRFDVAWQLQNNGKTLLNLPIAKTPTQQQQRLTKCLGQNFIQQAIQFDNECSGMRLWGWLGKPSVSRNANDWQYFYLNGRMLKDKLIRHAVMKAYEAQLDPGRQPAYVLYLACDPQSVDVNVHPTKHEVRFCEARQVHDFIFTAIKGQLPSQPEPKASNAQFDFIKQAVSETQQESSLRIVGQAHGRYVFVEVETGITIIDYPKACQLLAYLQLTAAVNDGAVPTRDVLVPINLSCQEKQLDVLARHAALLQTLGLTIEAMGPDSVIIRQLPLALAQADLHCLLPLLLKCLQQDQPTLQTLIFTLCQSLSNQSATALSAESLSGFAGQLLDAKVSDLPTHLQNAVTTWPLSQFPVYSPTSNSCLTEV